jgi:ABC-2 type transport system ATP-binding protein/lipopolysaccharide transport system ATP-binding protein
MANLKVEAVTIDFPVYNANTRSMKNNLLSRGTGGRIGRDATNRICVRALDNVTLRLEHGDRVGLLGRNGSGKTTLLRVLAGVYQPVIGKVQRQGRVASLLDISLGIDPESTGYENIMLRGLLFGLKPDELRQRTEEIAAFTELGEYLSVPVRTYSSGMMLRLCFAVCTCVHPEILLMDEWIGAGDADFIDKAERRLQDFVSKAGILVLASHNPSLLVRNCTKGILLNAGRVISCGPIQEVLRQYSTST